MGGTLIRRGLLRRHELRAHGAYFRQHACGLRVLVGQPLPEFGFGPPRRFVCVSQLGRLRFQPRSRRGLDPGPLLLLLHKIVFQCLGRLSGSIHLQQQAPLMVRVPLLGLPQILIAHRQGAGLITAHPFLFLLGLGEKGIESQHFALEHPAQALPFGGLVLQLSLQPFARLL